MQTSRERFTVLDRGLIEQLDAVIDRLNFREDILDEPTITRPLPDKVTKREFLTTQSQEDSIYFDDDFMNSDFDPIPFTQKDVAHTAKHTQQINTLDPLRYGNLVKCVDCLFLDIEETGEHCMMQGDILLKDTLRDCKTYILKTKCA